MFFNLWNRSEQQSSTFCGLVVAIFVTHSREISENEIA